MITIVDYGVGNISAFAFAYKSLNIPLAIADSSDTLQKATRLILPGVGAFDYAMSRLQESGMKETLEDMVLNKKVPVMGVCVGMQMMGKHSEEGSLPGLGWIDGTVIKLQPVPYEKKLRLPHMGWNDATVTAQHPLFYGIDRSSFYFLHSYYFTCNNPENRISRTAFGTQHFDSAIGRENIYGVQFHPEKSHRQGMQLLQNFAAL